MHDWSEKDFDWRGLEEAGHFIWAYCMRWARLGGTYKEKYGTLRYSPQFWSVSLHTLIYPSYAYSQFPAWLWKMDIYYISPVLNFLLGKPLYKWQKYIHGKAYLKALKKWPHLRKEILIGALYPEFIPGATRREGHLMHVLGASGETISTWEGIDS